MNDRLPWGKFVWAHWEGDEALSLCSFAAQGLWMRLLCIAAKEGGYLRIGGKAPTVEKLAKIVRSSPAEVQILLDELAEEGVFSRTSDGTIYSRRMVRDAKSSAKNRENGKKGGNPNIGKDKENPASVNPPDEPHAEKGVKADKEKEKERDKKGSEPNGSGGQPPLDGFDKTEVNPPPESSADPLKPIWRLGIALLTQRAGLTDPKARSLVGKWVRSHDPEYVRQAMQAAWDAGSRDPVSYVTRAIPNIEAENHNPMLRPDAFRQRLWMQDFRAFPNQWREHERGPRPGEPGCRVTAEIQAEYPDPKVVPIRQGVGA